MTAREELRDLFRKIESMPPRRPAASRVTVRNIGDYQLVQQQEGQQQLGRLWRQEQAATGALFRHFNVRMHDPNLPKEETISGVSKAQTTLGHPDMTDVCYEVLLSTHQGHLCRNVDRLVYNSGLVSVPPQTLPQAVFPFGARETLADFGMKYGKPNDAEEILLCRACDLWMFELVVFYNHFWQGNATSGIVATKILERKMELRAESCGRKQVLKTAGS